MSIVSEKVNQYKVIIKIQGELDNKQCHLFKEKILEHLADNVPNICIDLAEMDYIDSPGIGVLLAASAALKSSDGKLVIINPQIHILDLLEATQVSRYLQIES